MIIGITGFTCSGKSYIANLIYNCYKDYVDIYVFDCDKIYHNLTNSNQFCWQKLEKVFNAKVINSKTNTVDDNTLLNTTFSNKIKTTIINYLTWKYIIDKNNKIIDILNSHDICIIDYSLLFPSNLDKICDKIIMAEASYTKRMSRIIARDKINSKEAFDKVHAQLDINYTDTNVLRINTNNGLSHNTLSKIIEFIEE